MSDNLCIFPFQRLINKLNLQSEDFAQAVAAQLTKDDKPVFAKL